MKSRNWSRESALACTISLALCAGTQAQPGEPRAKTPVLALLDAADTAQWRTWTQSVGWQVVAVPAEPDANLDKRVRDLAAKVEDAVKNGTGDPTRVFLAGRGDDAAAVFYAIARIPDRWSAGVALGGSPKAAIDTNRVFAANFTGTPVLWAGSGPDDEAYAEKLKSAGLTVEWRPAEGLTNGAVIQWLLAHTRDPFPPSIDCETNSPAFASCFWIQMTKFDPAERNDVLPLSLVPGDAGTSLDLGGFGYKANDPGPGVTVVFLGEKYSGPLKVGDRLVALDGKPIDNAHQLVETLTKTTEARPAVVMIQRGKERIRIETRILVPRHDPVITARIQGKYMPEDHQILIVSRSVTEMRLTVPPAWVPGTLNWNGLSLENLQTAGCYALSIEKELLRAAPCQ